MWIILSFQQTKQKMAANGAGVYGEELSGLYRIISRWKWSILAKSLLS